MSETAVVSAAVVPSMILRSFILKSSVVSKNLAIKSYHRGFTLVVLPLPMWIACMGVTVHAFLFSKGLPRMAGQVKKCVSASNKADTTITQSLHAAIMDAIAYRMLAMFTLISSFFLVFIRKPQRFSDVRELEVSDFYTAPIKRGWSMRLTRIAMLRRGYLVWAYASYVTHTVSPLAALPRATREIGDLPLSIYHNMKVFL